MYSSEGCGRLAFVAAFRKWASSSTLLCQSGCCQKGGGVSVHLLEGSHLVRRHPDPLHAGAYLVEGGDSTWLPTACVSVHRWFVWMT